MNKSHADYQRQRRAAIKERADNFIAHEHAVAIAKIFNYGATEEQLGEAAKYLKQHCKFKVSVID